MKIRQTYICEPVRTPVGKFGGAYKQLDAQFLGAAVVKGLLKRAGLPGDTVDDVLFAQCYSSMDAPALGRVVAIDIVIGCSMMVVLATGVVPNTADVKIPVPLQYDDYGFIDGTTDIPGIYAAGCVKRPCDVARSTKDATAAALKAVQCLNWGE